MLLRWLALSVGEGASAGPVQLDKIEIPRLDKSAKSTLARPASCKGVFEANQYPELSPVGHRVQVMQTWQLQL